ncbi:MAG: hypothetical protein WC070_02495 [Candidatus Magasanikbacteria bacterium]
MSLPEQKNVEQIEATMMEIAKIVNKDVLLDLLHTIDMSKAEFVIQVGEDIDNRDQIIDALLGHIESGHVPLSEVLTGEPIGGDLEEDISDLDDEQVLALFKEHLEKIGLFNIN